jgi:predicted nucleic acid-binding protein
MQSRGVLLVIPEIADYELRRELLRGQLSASVERLDVLGSLLRYAPISTPIMRLAAESWAESRRTGRPTAPDLAIDADVVLAAQAMTFARDTGMNVVVATTNPRHISRFVPSSNWPEIAPL